MRIVCRLIRCWINPLLDKILKAYIDEGKTIDEIVAGGDDRDLVEQIISRYQRMVFKRQQMAESLAI